MTSLSLDPIPLPLDGCADWEEALFSSTLTFPTKSLRVLAAASSSGSRPQYGSPVINLASGRPALEVISLAKDRMLEYLSGPKPLLDKVNFHMAIEETRNIINIVHYLH